MTLIDYRPKTTPILRAKRDLGAVGNGATDDRAVLQAGLDRLAAIGGGILFLDGTFGVGGAGLDANHPGLHVEGFQGDPTVATYKGSQLVGIAGRTGPVLTISGTYCGVRGIRISGGSASGGAGPCLLISSARNVIENIYVDDAPANVAGIHVNGTSLKTAHANFWTNVFVKDCLASGAYGIWLQSFAYDQQMVNIWVGTCTNNFRNEGGTAQVIGLHSWGSTNDGLEIRSAANWHSDCYIESNGVHGVDLFNVSDNHFFNSRFWKNAGVGVRLDTGSRHKVQGCTIYDNGLEGIRLNATTLSVVNGNSIYDDQGTKTQDRAINETGASDLNVYVGNIMRAADHVSSTASAFVGASNVKANNIE